MKAREEQTGFVSPRLLFAIRFCMVAAIGLGCYLLWVSLSGGTVAGCGPDSSCDKVLHSKWSRWLGLPVSGLALLIYSGLFAGTFWLRRTVRPSKQRTAWNALIPCSVAIIGAALWFLIVQALILQSYCPFCLAAHGCGLAAAVMLLSAVPFRKPPEKPWQKEKQVFVPPALGRKLVFIALAAVSLLVAGQFLGSPPKQYGIANVDAKIQKFISTNTLISASQTVASTTPQYVMSLFGGKIEMDLREVPVLGPPEAPFSIVSLFDYTCHYCRTMHLHLMEAHRKFGNQLAIVSLPMPLSEKCNHTVKRSQREHAQACDYARIGLAVWRANRKAQAQFDDWIFGPPAPPPLAEARQYASQISGLIGFEAAMKDPWIDRQIQRDISIYETNYLRGKGNMPQLFIGTNLAYGNFARVEDLYRLLSDNLGLRSPGQ